MQKIKSNILSIYLFICVIRYGILTILIKNKKVSNFNNDLIRYFGEFPEFYLLCAIFVSILLFRILHIFNHSNSNEYEWLNIIKVLNGSKSLDSLKINNKNEIQKYTRKIKTFKFFLTFCVYLFLFFNY
jgi:hypothetical protein